MTSKMTREDLFQKLRTEGIRFNEDMLMEVFDFMKENLHGEDAIDIISN